MILKEHPVHLLVKAGTFVLVSEEQGNLFQWKQTAQFYSL